MKTMTVEELNGLMALDGWVHTVDYDIYGCETHNVEVWCENEHCLTTTETDEYGAAYITSTLGDITITYTEGFNRNPYMQGSLTTSNTGDYEGWAITGVKLVDEDGDEITFADMLPYLYVDAAFDAIDFSTLLPQPATHNIDIDEDTDMETYTLSIDNAPDIRFKGTLLAKVSSSPDKAFGRQWSGETGRWTTLAIYQTVSGKYICHQIGHTQWQGERTRYSGAVCETLAEVFKFFGHRWLAKALYDEAEIYAVQDVD